MPCLRSKFWLCVTLSFLCHSAEALSLPGQSKITIESQRSERVSYQMYAENFPLIKTESSPSVPLSRRNVFRQAGIVSATMFLSTIGSPILNPAQAADTLDGYLYKIIRVREATQQERRLITSGKFKDTQRANVKLAVKFMVQNYRLSDSVVGASAFLSGGNTQQMRAIDTGQSAVQNLVTILEYFDSSDVENIKVGKNSMSGKEEIVLKGLEATQVKLDEFLSFFDQTVVERVSAQIQEENKLNVEEFDKTLGDIINLAPPS